MAGRTAASRRASFNFPDGLVDFEMLAGDHAASSGALQYCVKAGPTLLAAIQTEVPPLLCFGV